MTSPKTSDELLPCPFCGGEAHVRNRKKEWYNVGCKNESCIMYVPENNTGIVTLDHYTFISEENAIKAWNTRVGYEVDEEAVAKKLMNPSGSSLDIDFGIVNEYKARFLAKAITKIPLKRRENDTTTAKSIRF